MTILVGADPELFVTRRGTNTYISGHEIKCGDKFHPTKTEHGSVQNDGLALEFNVTPAGDAKSFVDNVGLAYGDLLSIVKKHDPQLFLVACPVADFTPEYLKSLPPDVLALGCNPDFNAYTIDVNPAPIANEPIRTGSGHVHLGWTDNAEPESEDHFRKCCAVTRQLDYYLGLPSLKWDPDNKRRSLYGRAGAFRPKKYGMEYRVLSNAWMTDQELQEWIFNRIQAAWDALEAGHILDNEYLGFAKESIDKSIRDWERDEPDLAVELLEGLSIIGYPTASK